MRKKTWGIELFTVPSLANQHLVLRFPSMQNSSGGIKELSNDNSGDNEIRIQQVHISEHETNALRPEIEATFNTLHISHAREQSRGSLSVTPSPKPEAKRRHPSPATQVSTCGSLSDKPHSGEEETWNTSPARYFLSTLLDASSVSTSHHRLADKVHPTQGSQATRGDRDQQSEGGEPDFKATDGKRKAGSFKSD